MLRENLERTQKLLYGTAATYGTSSGTSIQSRSRLRMHGDSLMNVMKRLYAFKSIPGAYV